VYTALITRGKPQAHNIQSPMPSIAAIQYLLKLPTDAVWSPTDQAALLSASKSVKKKIQALLGVDVDGVWMSQSQGALNALVAAQDGWITCKASSFADPGDLAVFKLCKASGKSDVQCFAKGDNGIGEFGDITAQTVTPFVAIHKSYMISRWGSVHAAAHREVIVWINGVMKTIKVGDRISEPGRIDLNPAAYCLWKFKAPLMVVARWRWA
jgi:hypothetical protein